MLEPHLENLASLPHKAVKRYRESIAPQFAVDWPRLRSNAIQPLMIEEHVKVYGPQDVVTVGNRKLWRANPVLVLQFKKLNAKGTPSNIPTETARRFNAQLWLPDFPPGMRITLGYVIDADRLEVVEVRIMAQRGEKILFSRELFTNQAVIPLVAAMPAAAPKRRRLRAKADDAVKATRGKKAGGEPEGNDA